MSMFDSSVAKNGHSLNMKRSVTSFFACSAALPSSSHDDIALPKPYQPGNSSRHCPQEKPQGKARRSSILRVDLRDAGREPKLSTAISAIGVAAKKYSENPGSSYTSLRYARYA